MPRPTKPHKLISARINIDIYDRLNKHIEESGVTKTAAIEKALSMYLDDCDQKKRILEKYWDK